MALDATDRSIMAARGWAGSNVDFPTLGAGEPDSPQIGLSSTTVLGPFRLGMTVEDVRRQARSANLLAVEGAIDGGWCKAPEAGGVIGLVIPSPTNRYSKRCAYRSSCSSYSLKYEPIGRILRLTSIDHNRKDKTKKVSIAATDTHLVPVQFHHTIFSECNLTSAEYDLAKRHESFENNPLQEILRNPISIKSRLPKNVQIAANDWEKSIEVIARADCCDVYSRAATFNGSWHTTRYFILSYDISVTGISDYNYSFLVAVDKKGKQIWKGRPADFKKVGLKSKKLL